MRYFIYVPFGSKDNQYINISMDCINKIKEVELIELSEIKTKPVDGIILNWYENISRDKSFIHNVLSCLRRVFFLLKIKRKGVVITTFHNKLPHDVKYYRLAYLYMKVILKLANKIIILSSESEKYLLNYLSQGEIENKAFYIPHPNYINIYGNRIKSQKTDVFRVLFMGQIRRYKNIEVVLELAKRLENKNIEITIAGKPQDEKYKMEILKQIEGTSNIKPILRFIEDDEIPQLMADSDVLFLPYDIQSSLNSGTVVLAFSYAKTIVCPQIATLSDFDNEFLYGYRYNNYDEHIRFAEESLLRAYEEWDNNYEKFVQKGEELLRQVKENNSEKVITERYEQLFSEV